VSHCAAAEQPTPTDDAHAYVPSRLPQASMSSVPVPEQHSAADGGSGVVPWLTHVHTLVVQTPVTQPSAPMHAPPVTALFAHTFTLQNAELQSSSAEQGIPSGAISRHVPVLHSLDVQSSSAEHGIPSACTSWQVPVLQRPDVHASSPVQAVPSVSLAVQTLAAQ
jgi:hypothetical protein